MRNHKCGCNRNDCNSCNPCDNKKSKPPCCPANIPDSFFTQFFANVDACNAGPNDPFNAAFAPDVLARISLFFPAPQVCGPGTQFYGLDAVLANRAVFCANSIDIVHEIVDIERYTFTGCDLIAVANTNFSFTLAANPALRFTGTQRVTFQFDENCKIDTFIVDTVGSIGPINPVPGATLRGTEVVDALNDPRFADLLRALGRAS